MVIGEKIKLRVKVKGNQNERLEQKQQAIARKQILIKRYQKQAKTTSETKITAAEAPAKINNDPDLKRKNRQLQRKLKQIQQLQVTKQAEQQRLRLQNQRRLHELKAQLTATQAELQATQAQNQALVANHEKLSEQLHQAKSLNAGASAWFAQSVLLYQWAARILADSKQIQRNNEAQRPITTLEKRKLKSYSDLKQNDKENKRHLRYARSSNEQLRLEIEKLRARPVVSHKLTEPLVKQVMDQINPAQIKLLAWLPAAYHEYQWVVKNQILVNDGNRVFGYFIPHADEFYFQVVNGRLYRHYQRFGQAKRKISLKAVYAGKVDGPRVLVNSVFYDIAPSEIKAHHELQLHRRHPRSDYHDLLPEDATARLTGKQVLVVTWQRAQTLDQMFRSFGIIPTIVNDHEKSTNWIATAALSNQTDFTLLLSEGLSHSMLETIGKDNIKERDNIELVYNEAPADLLQRCYRFFSSEKD